MTPADLAEFRARAADWSLGPGEARHDVEVLADEVERLMALITPASNVKEPDPPDPPDPPIACAGFQWLGQSWEYCERCNRPAREHVGVERPAPGAGPFSDDVVIVPWAELGRTTG